MRIKRSKQTIFFNISGFFMITCFALFCLVPFILIISGSFTDNGSLMRQGYHLIPQTFSVQAYITIFTFPKGIIDAYINTIWVTGLGTCIGLFCISMAGYVLQRKDFRYRHKISFFIYFTTIFGGGLVPWYILMSKYLHMQNTYLARIFPLLMSPFLIILMRTFISASVPDELNESAKIDGAGDFKIYHKIVLPVIVPGLATVGLFLALGYWNDWFLTSLYITNKKMYSLQFYLYDILNSIRFAQEMVATGSGVNTADLPTESIKMAMVVIVTGPILFLYPFVQRYFIRGLTIGAVKG